jgi:hypothetical protein
VFYSSSCNVTRETDQALVQAGLDEESLSVREAVKLAKGQNMLGLVLDCRILVIRDETLHPEHVTDITLPPGCRATSHPKRT